MAPVPTTEASEPTEEPSTPAEPGDETEPPADGGSTNGPENANTDNGNGQPGGANNAG